MSQLTGAFALTMLSNVEKALRESSNTRAPIKCWGCEGAHLYKDCPSKDNSTVQQRFKAKLDEYLANRRRGKFDPSTYKRDGFLTKKAVTLFNDINDDNLNGQS